MWECEKEGSIWISYICVQKHEYLYGETVRDHYPHLYDSRLSAMPSNIAIENQYKQCSFII